MAAPVVTTQTQLDVLSDLKMLLRTYTDVKIKYCNFIWNKLAATLLCFAISLNLHGSPRQQIDAVAKYPILSFKMGLVETGYYSIFSARKVAEAEQECLKFGFILKTSLTSQ